MGKLFYGVGASDHILITEPCQSITIHEKKVEVKVEEAGLRVLQTEVVSDKKDKHTQIVQHVQNQLEHRKKEVIHHKEIIAQLSARLGSEDLSEAETDKVLGLLKDQHLLIRNHVSQIEAIQEKTTVGVHYEIRTTGASALLSEGLLQQPSFLPKAVCWAPFGVDIELQGVSLVPVTENKFEEMPYAVTVLGEEDCKWFEANRVTYISAEEKEAKVAEYRAAAELGCAYGQYLLGWCYYVGGGYGGVPQDAKKAFEWWTLSSEQGNSWGQRMLALCYQYGNGVSYDKKRALELFALSGEQGNAAAQYRLGEICRRGFLGVAVDHDMATYWYKKSAAQGHQRAKHELEKLNNN